jgi:hypothetical protein
MPTNIKFLALRVLKALISLLAVFSLVISGSGLLQKAEAQSGRKISIDFGESLLGVELQEAVLETITRKPDKLLIGTHFAVTSQRIEENWALISIASLDGPDSSLEYVGSKSAGSLILATYSRDFGWRATLAGTASFSSLVKDAPESLISTPSKLLINPIATSLLSSQTVDYKFPWASDSWEYRQGWHEPAALGVDIGTRRADRSILSSADGTITYICRNGSSTANIKVAHSDGKVLEYWHLEKSLPSEITEGAYVVQGQKLGTLKSGSFQWDGCGMAPDQSTAHLHWVIPTNASFTVDGWTIQYPDSTWRKGGQQISPPGSSYPLLTSTNKPVAAILYEHSNFGGHALGITQSIHDLCYYRLDNNQKENHCLNGTGTASWGNQASSIRVMPGYSVILFLHALDSDIDQYGQSQARFGCTTNIADFSPRFFEGTTISLNENISKIEVEPCSGTSSQGNASENDIASMVDNPCAIQPPPASNDSASFLSDITLPDGISVNPNQAYVKTWRLKNTGSTTWGNGYQLVFIRGEQMGSPTAVNVPTTAPNAMVNLSINLTAPTAPGTHSSYWRLRNPQGTFFGPEIFVKITVPGGAVPPPSGEAISLQCIANCFTQAFPGQTFRPTIRVTVHSGQLLQSRGDMWRNTDGNLLGAHPFIAVVGAVNPGGHYDFTFYAANPIVAPTTPGTYESKWRVWRDGNFVGPEWTLRFQVTAGGGSNRAPNRPTLTGTDWGVYTVGQNFTLQASHNGDPDGDAITGYYFELLGTNPGNSGWLSSGSWTPSNLSPAGYQWRVKVKDSRGAESDWSEQTWNFTVQTNEPQIYSFSYMPARPAWNQGEPEKLVFCANTNAGTLRLQINTAPDGSDRGEWIVLNEIGLPNYACNNDDDRPPTWSHLNFPPGTYRARLYARRDGGWLAAASQDILVTVSDPRRPGNPMNGYPYGTAKMRQGAQPSGGMYVASKEVHFDWTDTLRTDSYHLEVSDNSSFTGALLLDKTFLVGTSEYTHTFPIDYPKVYWRVTAAGPGGSHQAGTDFHIDITSPDSVVASLPSVSFEPNFTVNWSGTDARSGVRWYHVQVRDGNRADSLWQDWLVNTTKTSEIFQGQTGHVYYFRVRAMDNINNWEAWPTSANGDTLTLIDPTAAPTAPWWNNGFGFRRNLVVLNSDSNTMPAPFPVHIHFDATTSPTAAEIYNASLSAVKGNDVRIVYNNQTELHRFVQSFTAEQIDLWFPLQAALASGQTSNGDYQIYYGNSSAGNPPSNINSVFLPEADGNATGVWHFQEGSGNVVADSSGNSNHGSFNNSAWVNGFMGWAGNFNNPNAAVIVPHSSVFNTSAMTIEAWVYIANNDGKWSPIVMKLQRSPDGPGGFEFRLTNDREIRWLIKNYWIHSGSALSANRWYHVAAVSNGSNEICIYINGNRARCAQGGPLDFNTAPVTIGFVHEGSGDLSFPGYIQHVRISNIARYDFPYAKISLPATVAAGVKQTPPVSGSADLAMLSLTTYPNPGGGVIVQAVVQNIGTVSTPNGFFTDLYLNNAPAGVGSYGIQFWVNDPIAAGAIVTLTTVITDPTTLSQLPAALAPGSEVSGTLYGQVDSSGVVSEPNNTNNIYAAGTDICVATADAYEGDGTLATAKTIALGQSQLHNFATASDQDFVRFVAQQGVRYTLSTSNLGVSADTYLYLYGPDGVTLLASNDDEGGSLASQVRWVAPANGTYYLLVKHWNPNVSGCGTSYTLLVQVGTDYQVFLPLMQR